MVVFGGSFDPPHLGHQVLLQQVQQDVDADEVWVLPVGQAVHRTLTADVSARQRLRWVEASLGVLEGVRVLDWEAVSDRPVASVESMRRVVDALAGAIPYWVLGMDAWRSLPSWVGYPEHLAYCHILVVPRQGEAMVEHADWQFVAQPCGGAQAGCVSYMSQFPPAISSSLIRQRVAAGQNISGYVVAAIEQEVQAAYSVAFESNMSEVV